MLFWFSSIKYLKKSVELTTKAFEIGSVGSSGKQISGFVMFTCSSNSSGLSVFSDLFGEGFVELGFVSGNTKSCEVNS